MVASLFRRSGRSSTSGSRSRSRVADASARVEFTDLAPSPDVFLGQSAYLFLRYAESAARHAHDATDLETESTLAIVAEECFVRFSRLAAILDAMLQSASSHQMVMETVVAPLAKAQHERRACASLQAAATKVDFFTMVRGDG